MLSPSVLHIKCLALSLAGWYFCLRCLHLPSHSSCSQKLSTGRCKVELTHPHGDTWSQERRSYLLNKKQEVTFSRSIKTCMGNIYANFLSLRMEWCGREWSFSYLQRLIYSNIQEIWENDKKIFKLLGRYVSVILSIVLICMFKIFRK